MSAFLKTAHLLALGVWLGSVVFFSFVAAPTLFGALGRETAGRAVSAIFPRYYAIGGGCGAVALVSGLLLGVLQGAWGRSFTAALVLVAIMTGLVAYAGWILLPQASQARQERARSPEGTAGHEAAEAHFAALHRLSVLLNGAVLVLGIAAFALATAQRLPR